MDNTELAGECLPHLGQDRPDILECAPGVEVQIEGLTMVQILQCDRRRTSPVTLGRQSRTSLDQKS
jgi:hypothetical protein